MINEDAFSQLVVNEIPVNVRELFGIAKVCHEVNRAYCEALGDHSQLPWEQAPVWQRQSCVNGVLHHLANPDTSPEESHAVWLKEKLDAGWKYGPLKNETTKEHPCCVPYAELSESSKAKDFIFRAIVRELRARALSAVQADTRKRWACSYCGEELLVPAAADNDDAFKTWARNHVETACPKHPLRDRDARIAELGAKLLELTKRLEDVHGKNERSKECFELAVARQLINDNSPEAIRYKRKALGFTVEKLAETLVVAPNIIQGWENGTLPIDLGSSTRLGALIDTALAGPMWHVGALFGK